MMSTAADIQFKPPLHFHGKVPGMIQVVHSEVARRDLRSANPRDAEQTGKSQRANE